ncbi:hypothetical protein CR513_28936, partial [Mucuna pruriens]
MKEKRKQQATMPITRNQASSNSESEEGVLQRLMRVVANLHHEEELKRAVEREAKLSEELLINPFKDSQDPRVHLQAFQTQVYISGGNDLLSFKLFLGTLKGVTMRWFSGL